VAELDGFGEKTQVNICEGIERRACMPRNICSAKPGARRTAARSLRQHPDVILRAAGSLRRWNEIIGDIDLLASSKKPPTIDYFAQQPGIIKVTAAAKPRRADSGGIQSICAW
jgi:DNA polymerase/3'-5' exonuclease PolX